AARRSILSGGSTRVWMGWKYENFGTRRRIHFILHLIPTWGMPMRIAVKLLMLAVSLVSVDCSKSATSATDTSGGAADKRAFTATISGGSFGSSGTFASGCPGQTCSANIGHSSTFFSVYGYDFTA